MSSIRVPQYIYDRALERVNEHPGCPSCGGFQLVGFDTSIYFDADSGEWRVSDLSMSAEVMCDDEGCSWSGEMGDLEPITQPIQLESDGVDVADKLSKLGGPVMSYEFLLIESALNELRAGPLGAGSDRNDNMWQTIHLAMSSIRAHVEKTLGRELPPSALVYPDVTK